MARATKDFHSVKDIPHGATLKVEASNISGNVEDEGTMFMSGPEGVADVEWTLQQLEDGTAQTSLAGPGISMTRVVLTVSKGAAAQIDMIIHHQGQEIRRLTWNLTSPDADRVGRIGLLIAVKEPGN